MQTWSLSAGDPLALTLAADARLTCTDYTDDQIWELILGGGEPAAMAVQTTFGLRAHWMRLFPRFIRIEAGRSETARIDPAAFHSPPKVVRFTSNQLTVIFTPFEGLEVQAEYWTADSHIIVGRIRMANQSILTQAFRMEWVAMLNPIDRQGGMAPLQVGPNYVLEGETAYLHPVVFLTGGPQPVSSPYPALALDLELYPGNERQVTWACASLRSYEASLEAARAATGRPWEAEQARIDLLNFSQVVQIETGKPEWDAAFALAQKAVFGMLMGNDPGLPNPSFVLSRRPDQGFSVRGDGSDHTHLWSGQSVLDSYYLASLLLPGAPELVAGIVRNFLSVQDPSGAIDWKPGLGGQRTRRLAQPMLATIAAQVGPYGKTVDWYREVFPGLLRFFNAWFLPIYDHDTDGFPEWEHPLQTGIEDSPMFDRWSPNAQGINISRLECPSLAAMLLRECQSLIEIARSLADAEKAESAYARLSAAADANPAPPADADTPSEPRPVPVSPQLSGAAEALPALLEREQALRDTLQSTWDEEAKFYRYRDYQSHLSLPGVTLAEFTGPGKVTSRKKPQQPRRLVVHLRVSEERTYAVRFTVHGTGPDGDISETIEPLGFSWLGLQGRATTENTFLAVKRMEVQGLGEEDQVRVYTADYTQEDCSLFLPLWASAPSTEQARKMVEEALLPRYLQPFGIPLCPPEQVLQDALPGLPNASSSALLPWNHLLGEGLIRYGYRDEAARIVTRLMNAIVSTLKEQRAFRQYYHAETGLPSGERDHLHGLPPLGLFLQTLGIRRLAPKEILIDGFSPYPQPVNVKYRKVCLTCEPEKTTISFPGGQSVTIDQPGLHKITLE